jgi:hypothetical protein
MALSTLDGKWFEINQKLVASRMNFVRRCPRFNCPAIYWNGMVRRCSRNSRRGIWGKSRRR